MKTKLGLFILYGCFLAFACKKNGNDIPPSVTMGKIYEDDKLLAEFIYSADKKLVRENYYEKDGSLDYGIGFVYNANGYMIWEEQFNAANKQSGKVQYFRDGNNRITKHEYNALSGSDSGKVTTRVKYDYDADGNLVSQTWVDIVTEKPETVRELTYHKNKSLRSSSVYYYLPQKQLQWRTDYGLASDTAYAGMKSFSAYPVDFRVPEFSATDLSFRTFNEMGVVTKEFNQKFTNRKYDAKGYLIEQLIVESEIIPAGLGKKRRMRYEYRLL